MEKEIDASLVLSSAVGIRRVAIGRRPLRIGSRDDCDLVVTQPRGQHDREIVIWQQQGQVLLRSMPDKVEVNGRAWSWALLDDRDQIRLGAHTLTVEIHGDRDEQVGPVRPQLERRASFRLPVEAPGQLLDHPSLSDVEAANVLVTDVGDGGARVLTSVRMIPDEQIAIEVAIPPDGAQTRLQLVVRSIRPTDDDVYPFAAHCKLVESGTT